MPGGTCEASTFSAYGYESTCLCLPMGNYHNMVDIDGVLAGARPARVGSEYISVEDFHGLVELLDRGREICIREEDAIPSSVGEAHLEGVSLAPVGLVAKRANGNLQLGREGLDQLEGPVLASIIHQDELDRVRPRREVFGDHALEQETLPNGR